ncbi:hypothetical protein LGK95_21450 [Clostridium algoriphilum]|uniref:AbrB/MazE/SpoVT family DNA-binding domain-containing protein n=1 Tax=Clostridium algoriphilum TaxID=198347 RepID=UPI001CF3296B|nr:hypothetical protein [Clostridium algoriphilum]MCB2296020.1 hypothetical protein [Clostridium algoriphilum]
MSKKISKWSGALAVRITTEAKELGWKAMDDVNVTIEDNKIIIEKVTNKLNTEDIKVR